MEKVIYWELCKRLKFDHTTKWYMHQLMHKILWNFEIQTDHLISPWRWDREIISIKRKKERKKENLPDCGQWRPDGVRNKNQRKWKERQVLGPYLRTKKAVEHKSDGDTNCYWCTWDGSKKLGKGGGRRVGNRRTIETIQITALLTSARILRRILETKGDLLPSRLHWKTIS